MIKLKIQPTTFNLRSTEVPVEIVASERQKDIHTESKITTRDFAIITNFFWSIQSTAPVPTDSSNTVTCNNTFTFKLFLSLRHCHGAPKLDDVISRKSLAEIAKKITHWKPLDIPVTSLDTGRGDCPKIQGRTMECRKREFLEVWKVMKGEGATYEPHHRNRGSRRTGSWRTV
ncbi:hypothetical protein GBAR_LOCUS27721 [Geodia barretti]|uniref:Uncharacterized protein n=1 Tax=Geodia barretti TaxID=519541 RepID=A0AA35XFH2_GEOBA|nr:hypothetical protein GBAR_LOCUS27721 [Geodia barretti]